MGREELYDGLNEIFRNNFDDESIVLSDSTCSDDIEDWNSLEQINLIVEIQDKYGIKFNIEEVNAMKNVGEMVDFILKKMV